MIDQSKDTRINTLNDRNAEVGYAIIDGNEDDIFEIRDENNVGVIYVKKRLDREVSGL